MKEFCQLTFVTNAGKTRIMRIPDPAVGLTASTVENCAIPLLALPLFRDEATRFNRLRRADRVSTTVTTLIEA